MYPKREAAKIANPLGIFEVASDAVDVDGSATTDPLCLKFSRGAWLLSMSYV